VRTSSIAFKSLRILKPPKIFELYIRAQKVEVKSLET